MQHEISFIDFAHVSSLFLKCNNKILASKTAIPVDTRRRTTSYDVVSTLKRLRVSTGTQQKKFNISVQDPSKVIFNFSKYDLRDCEKRLFAKDLNFSLPPKHLDIADCLVDFEFFYRNIRNLCILSNEGLDFVKTRTKEAALSSYRNYNNITQQHLSKEALLAL